MHWKRRRFSLAPPSSSSEEEFLSWKWTFWRFYAWFLVIWLTLSYAGVFSQDRIHIADIQYLDAFVSIPALIGIMAFAYRKKVFWPILWRFYTPMIMGWDLWGSFWFINSPQECLDFFQGGWVSFLIQYILLLPLYIALFRLGFPR